MFIAALFTVAKKVEIFMSINFCLSIDKQKLVYSSNGIVFSHKEE